MKITKTRLHQIIKEEIESIITEGECGNHGTIKKEMEKVLAAHRDAQRRSMDRPSKFSTTDHRPKAQERIKATRARYAELEAEYKKKCSGKTKHQTGALSGRGAGTYASYPEAPYEE